MGAVSAAAQGSTHTPSRRHSLHHSRLDAGLGVQIQNGQMQGGCWLGLATARPDVSSHQRALAPVSEDAVSALVAVRLRWLGGPPAPESRATPMSPGLGGGPAA